MADEENGDTEQMVTIETQNSLQMQNVAAMDVKSTSASVADAEDAGDTSNKNENENNNNDEIERKETTLKDNEHKSAIDNDTESIDLKRIQDRARKASIHLQEIGDMATMRELEDLEAKQRARMSPKQQQAPPNTGSFLGDNLNKSTDSMVQITPTSSFLIRHDAITTILIDEFNADSTIKEFETIEVELPRSPMAALILMELLGIYEEMDNWTKAGIFCAIFLTIIIQFVAASALYFQKFFSSSDYEYGNALDGVMNMVVMSFVVVYLAQDCAKLYKMYILLKHVTDKKGSKNTNSKGNNKNKKPENTDIESGRVEPITQSGTDYDKSRVKKRDVGFLWLFIITNFCFYIFLLYYALLETLGRTSLPEKLQIAIAVFFLLELDDWVYNITIEPLQVLEDSVFELKIRANKGSRKKRFRSITRLFWGIFFTVQASICLLYFTGSFESLSI